MRTIQMAMACVAVLVATAGQVQAGIILVNDATLNSLGVAQDGFNITRDLNNNRDWLDFSLTINKSFNSVAPLLGTGGILEGWRYATAADFEQLGQAAAIPASVIDQFAASAASAPPELIVLQRALGTTRFSDTSSFAVFDEIGVSTSSKRLGGITLARAIFDIPNDPQVWLPQSWGPNDVNPSVGVALVRDNVAAVPEPTSLAVFAIGACVAGLGAARRRRGNQQVAITA